LLRISTDESQEGQELRYDIFESPFLPHFLGAPESERLDPSPCSSGISARKSTGQRRPSHDVPTEDASLTSLRGLGRRLHGVRCAEGF
jgi:hypothetical protein